MARTTGPVRVLGLCVGLVFMLVWVIPTTQPESSMERKAGTPVTDPPHSAPANHSGHDSKARHAPDAITTLDPTATPPLPNPTLPLADQLPHLTQRVEQGDPVAVCQLIGAMSRCRAAYLSMSSFRSSTQRRVDAQTMTPSERVNALRHAAQQWKNVVGDHCAGVTFQQLPDPEVMFREHQARLGPRQKTVLALLRPDGSLRRVHVDPAIRALPGNGLEVISQFQADHTEAFLQEGYRARDPLALEGLVLLHAPALALKPTHVGVWLPDPKRFLQYAALMRALHGEAEMGVTLTWMMRNVEAGMSSQELAAVRAFVEHEIKDWRKVATLQTTKRTDPQRVAPEAPEITPCADPTPMTPGNAPQ